MARLASKPSCNKWTFTQLAVRKEPFLFVCAGYRSPFVFLNGGATGFGVPYFDYFVIKTTKLIFLKCGLHQKEFLF